MMKLLISSVLLAAVGASDLLRYQMVNQVNSDPTSTWVARVHDRFKGTSFEKTASLCGSLPEPSGLTTVYHHALTDDALAAIPTSFDAREEWPQCASIREVRDQSDCGSCWAFGAAEAATDRICIASNAKFTPHLSAQTLNSCCTSCGSGCNGGYPSSAWSYLAKTGIPTGGNYGDYSGCQAYSMAPCDHHVTGKYGPCPSTSYKTPTCSKTCDSKSTSPLKFADDVSKNVFSSSYSISSTVSQIQAEILANGPVEASFTVYADFETYSSGVYQHKTGSNLGGHAVKLLGWGVENNTPYWLLANSWNEGWGEKGFFKILRGSNHCGIESSIVAGKFTYKA